jgi:hypothetical protein
MDQEVAGHFRPFTAKRKTATSTRTCPVMKSQKGKPQGTQLTLLAMIKPLFFPDTG